MFNDIVSAFSREFVQNGSYLPKVVRSACAVLFAIGALAFHDPIVAGVVDASHELGQEMMDRFQPLIDNIVEHATPQPAPAP